MLSNGGEGVESPRKGGKPEQMYRGNPRVNPRQLGLKHVRTNYHRN